MNEPLDPNLLRIVLKESSDCPKCKRKLFEGSMKGSRTEYNTDTYTEEILEHDCGFKFVARYELFTNEHITPNIFSEDCNDLNVKWYDKLPEGQKKLALEHLEKCAHCQEKRDQMALEEAELAVFLDDIRKRTGTVVKPRDFRKPGKK